MFMVVQFGYSVFRQVVGYYSGNEDAYGGPTVDLYPVDSHADSGLSDADVSLEQSFDICSV